MIFAAVAITGEETPHKLVQLILESASKEGRLFSMFELMGYLYLGSRRFIRFRCGKASILDTLKGLGRDVVLPQGEGYVLWNADGTNSGQTVPGLSLQSIPERHVHRMYRGPAAKFWERQFLV